MGLPAGTVTFLFTDIEGSTRLLQQLGDEYGRLMSQHRRVMRDAAATSGGSEIDAQGDSFFFGFPRARDAVAGSLAAQRQLAAESWPGEAEIKVRMGLHTGEPTLGDEGYLGLDVVRGARIANAAHGGQILVSETTCVLLPHELPDGAELLDLGEHALKGIDRPERLYQLNAPGLASKFPAPRTQTARHEDELERKINAFVERKVMGALEGFDLTEMSSGGWMLRRRKRDT